jgi:hypothetical protein
MTLFGVTLNQFVKTGVMAALFLMLFKWGAARSGIPGLQTAAALT